MMRTSAPSALMPSTLFWGTKLGHANDAPDARLFRRKCQAAPMIAGGHTDHPVGALGLSQRQHSVGRTAQV